jgi:hypothetical protein
MPSSRGPCKFATISNPAFTTIYTENYNPFDASSGSGSTLVSLTDTTGTIATHVTGIQFVYSANINDGTTEGSIIREVDVFGQASAVPEPASLGLLMLGGVMALRRKRATCV